MTNEFKKVIKEIEVASTIGLMTHINGDGDAFGSLLGLRNILESLGKKVILFSNEALPKYLEYLNDEARYKPQRKYIEVDLLVGLDLSVLSRFTIPEAFTEAKRRGARTVVVDHHTDGNLHTLVDVMWRKFDISSTAEMVYWLAEAMEVKINQTTAQLLLWGIETDTYFLSNPNVYKSTGKAQKVLWGLGASTEEIKENVKLASPTGNAEFMDLIYKRLCEYDSKILFTYITAADKKRFNIQIPVSSAVANFLDYDRKPRVVVVAEQRSPGKVKVSMRSNNSEVDVNEVAKNSGGGGHVHAAGLELPGEVEDFIEKGGLKKLLSRIPR